MNAAFHVGNNDQEQAVADFTNISAVVKFFNAGKGFGFFTLWGMPNGFVHETTLAKFGFTTADMAPGVMAEIDYDLDDDGKGKAVAIHRIGDKLATVAEGATPAKTVPAKSRRIKVRRPELVRLPDIEHEDPEKTNRIGQIKVGDIIIATYKCGFDTKMPT